MIAIIADATKTRMLLLCNCFQVGHVTLCNSSSYDSRNVVLKLATIVFVLSTGGETRTPDTWFWRPVLYQLSYTRLLTGKGEHPKMLTFPIKS